MSQAGASQPGFYCRRSFKRARFSRFHFDFRRSLGVRMANFGAHSDSGAPRDDSPADHRLRMSSTACIWRSRWLCSPTQGCRLLDLGCFSSIGPSRFVLLLFIIRFSDFIRISYLGFRISSGANFIGILCRRYLRVSAFRLPRNAQQNAHCYQHHQQI